MSPLKDPFATTLVKSNRYTDPETVILVTVQIPIILLLPT